MDFPETQPPRGRTLLRLAAIGVAILAVGAYAWVLGRNVAAVAAGSDSSGYMNHARLLASGRVHMEPRSLAGLTPEQAPYHLYVPLGFKPSPNGETLVPTYPTGLPLLILALEPLSGWRHAGDLTALLHSLAGIAVVCALGRQLGLGAAWAAIGAVIVALSPLYLFMALVAMSDVPSLVWTALAVLAALRSRERAGWALAAGAAIAMDVLLRPTNVLAFIPAAIAIGAAPRRWILFVLGGLPGAAFFFAHSMAAYGSLATTGYGDASLGFSLGFVPETLVHYARWLPLLMTPVVAFNLVLPFLGGESARSRWLLISWILAYGAFYSAYICTHETWWYLRFLLPAAPPLVIGGLLALRSLAKRLPRWADPGRSSAAAAVVLAVAAAQLCFEDTLLHPLSVGVQERLYGRVADWMTKNLPKDAVCLSMQMTGAIEYYTPFTFIRWDSLDAGNVGRVESVIRASGRPLYAVLFPFEVGKEGALDKRMPGHWTLVGNVEDVTVYRRDFGPARN
jgi:hypothetical protein